MSLRLHADPQVDANLWLALSADPSGDIKPTSLCRRARLSTDTENHGGDTYRVGGRVTLSSAVGTPALRKLVAAGLAEQAAPGQPYRLTERGQEAVRQRASELRADGARPVVLWVVELEFLEWLAPGEGVSTRTPEKHNAQRFNTRSEAEAALTQARTWRPFPKAKVIEA